MQVRTTIRGQGCCCCWLLLLLVPCLLLILLVRLLFPLLILLVLVLGCVIGCHADFALSLVSPSDLDGGEEGAEAKAVVDKLCRAQKEAASRLPQIENDDT